MQSKITSGSVQQMCSACRSPWPSRMRPSAWRRRRSASWRAQEVAAEATDGLVVGGGDGVAVEGVDLAEVVFQQLGDDRRVAAARDLGAGVGGGVERGQARGDGVDQIGADGVALEQARQHAVGRQAAHVHGVLDRVGGVLRRQREAAVALRGSRPRRGRCRRPGGG